MDIEVQEGFCRFTFLLPLFRYGEAEEAVNLVFKAGRVSDYRLDLSSETGDEHCPLALDPIPIGMGRMFDIIRKVGNVNR